MLLTGGEDERFKIKEIALTFDLKKVFEKSIYGVLT